MKSLHALGAHIAAFGFKPKYVVMFVVRVAIQLSMVVSLALDRLLLPGLTRTTLDRPIFLIGHLRSGTTFLHRFLLRSCPELRGLLMWEMLCPSVIGRWLTRPMRSWLGRVSLDAVYDPAIHETGLLTAETDDIALALRFNDGLLSWIYNDAWTEPPSETAVRAEVRSASRSRAFPAYLRGVYQRVAWRGPNRILSKSFYGLFCVDHIRELFPGARLLLLIREIGRAHV